MKQFLLILNIIIILTISNQTKTVFGQTATSKPTVSSGEKLMDEINNLREKVASKVAELNLVEKRGAYLTVSEVSGNKITGNDLNDSTRLIDVDELTKFASGSSKTFGISDITKDTRIGIIGLYNKQSKRILARFITTETLPVFISGIVTEIDKTNFTITVKSEDKKSTTVDIENITKTSTYSKEDGLTKLGFSKLNVSDRAYVVGFQNLEDNNRVSATRILIFPESPKNPNIEVTQASSDSFDKTTATPTKKVTPTE